MITIDDLSGFNASYIKGYKKSFYVLGDILNYGDCFVDLREDDAFSPIKKSYPQEYKEFLDTFLADLKSDISSSSTSLGTGFEDWIAAAKHYDPKVRKLCALNHIFCDELSIDPNPSVRLACIQAQINYLNCLKKLGGNYLAIGGDTSVSLDWLDAMVEDESIPVRVALAKLSGMRRIDVSKLVNDDSLKVRKALAEHGNKKYKEALTLDDNKAVRMLATVHLS